MTTRLTASELAEFIEESNGPYQWRCPFDACGFYACGLETSHHAEEDLWEHLSEDHAECDACSAWVNTHSDLVSMRDPFSTDGTVDVCEGCSRGQ